MNWNQIRQTLEESRSWYAAPSSFVRALKESLARRSNPRRTGAAACSQMELLEIRQVLSAVNPTFVSDLNAASVAEDISVPEDLSDASSTFTDLQSLENISDAHQHQLSGQSDDLDIPGSPLFAVTGNSVQTNGVSRNYVSYPDISHADSSGLLGGIAQSVTGKAFDSESHQLPPSNLGQSITHNNDTSLIDTVFQQSDSILDSSPSITSPVASSESSDKSPSLTEPTATQQDSVLAQTASEIQTPKVRSNETASTPAMWHNADSGHNPTVIAQHSNNTSTLWSATESDFGTRSMGRSPATELRFDEEWYEWTSSTTGASADFENSDGPSKVARRSRRIALSNIEEFYANADLFNSPFDFIVVADTASLSTMAIITDETFPIAVPRLTPETATSPATQNLPNMTATRSKQLREGHRQYSDIAVVSTEFVQHDGTPERAATEDIPRQLKHVVLPRGPPRKQPDTVLRIMDSDAEAHVLQRLRYSIAPRGPSTVTVEMQSPEECSFSGPRVSPEETCRVQLAC